MRVSAASARAAEASVLACAASARAVSASLLAPTASSRAGVASARTSRAAGGSGAVAGSSTGGSWIGDSGTGGSSVDVGTASGPVAARATPGPSPSVGATCLARPFSVSSGGTGAPSAAGVGSAMRFLSVC